MNTSIIVRRLPQINLKLLAAIFVVGVFSIFFGLLAVTANPIMIGLGAGMVLGPILLALPALTVWIVLVIGLLMGVLSANPQFSKVTWIVSILSMMLLLPSILNMLWSKARKAPAFILIALAFMGYSLVVSIAQWYSLAEFVAGFKRYFQMFGLMMAITLIIFTPQSFVRWRKFMLVIALLQFPFALYELLILVPQRGGLALSSYTTDIIAGTFGANMQGGSPNSVMVIFLFSAIAFLVARWRSGLVNSKYFYILFVIFMLPIGMGETKIALVMLPMVGLVLFGKDFMYAPLRYLPALIGVALLTFLLGYLYVVIMMQSSPMEVLESTLKYNIGSQGYSDGQYLNRWTSITFWLGEQSLRDPVGFIFGNGLGSSYTSTGAMAGHLGLKYLNYGINLTAASTILWDTGLIGLILFISIFVSAWFAAKKLEKLSSDPSVKADALAIQATIPLFMLSIVYSDSIVNLLSMEMLYAVLLGYLGYLLNQQGAFKRSR